MAIYTSASIALNFKASNLTHRGIIARGPYRYIRHPAYVCKNLAWWIGLMPALLVALETSLTSTLMTFGSMFGWSVIYYMRALTEEDHLRSVDGEYDAYCQKVKYRFIPAVI
jgi:protein-S-isoprenylcysteine O-methyltransferase Ste14